MKSNNIVKIALTIISAILIIVIMIFAIFKIYFKQKEIIEYSEVMTLSNTLNHNFDCFTEGLFIQNGYIYESVGLKGYSKIIKYDMQMNKLAEQSIDNADFGEGSTYFNGKIYMLTETSNTVYIFDANSLELSEKIPYNRTGWGLTTDGKYLIASDGSAKIYYMDENLATIRELTVTYNQKEVKNINELEYINGEIWANIWLEDYFVIIDTNSGQVKSKISLNGFVPEKTELKNGDSVLNGIAYDKENNKVYFTGKNWKHIYCFEI